MLINRNEYLFLFKALETIASRWRTTRAFLYRNNASFNLNSNDRQRKISKFTQLLLFPNAQSQFLHQLPFFTSNLNATNDTFPQLKFRKYAHI